MAQVGVHAILGLYFKKVIPNKRWLFTSFLIGAIAPDIDYILVFITHWFLSFETALSIFHRTVTHSFFTVILVYLIFAILSEFKKNENLKIIGRGIAAGMIFHILIDLVLWFQGVALLWPLPIHFNLWTFYQPQIWMEQFLMALEFLFFRVYGWILIQMVVSSSCSECAWIVKPLNFWMKLELALFMIFVLLVSFSINNYFEIFLFAYAPSLIIALFSTYFTRKVLE
ncbi:MAG: metal-dependent hydrolase [Candidatus Marinimicrobia bacterium]|nr:metal-dependent hydrolase [Candidatus Neomarinimicrobiota bacterium]MBL7023769.1 metal-dependent hydrolase [Candidatus Neomarinimicrobiota bacterium]MBL7110094.1 metal-dependent hydrolase [Candidatus Neomarinimicrobiota bacterium]